MEENDSVRFTEEGFSEGQGLSSGSHFEVGLQKSRTVNIL